MPVAAGDSGFLGPRPVPTGNTPQLLNGPPWKQGGPSACLMSRAVLYHVTQVAPCAPVSLPTPARSGPGSAPHRPEGPRGLAKCRRPDGGRG